MFKNENAIPITEASDNFADVIKIADLNGQAIIIKDNHPQYVLINLDTAPLLDLTDEEKIDIVTARVFKRFRRAFEELAK